MSGSQQKRLLIALFTGFLMTFPRCGSITHNPLQPHLKSSPVLLCNLNVFHFGFLAVLKLSICVFPHLVTRFYAFLIICVSQVVLLGMDILSALVTRLQERFRTQVGTGEQMIEI